MAEKAPENSVESDDTRVPLRETRAPAKVANFPGSLVANQLGDTVKASSYPQDKRNVAHWVAYFRYGWDDPGIWKGAVSNQP